MNKTQEKKIKAELLFLGLRMKKLKDGSIGFYSNYTGRRLSRCVKYTQKPWSFKKYDYYKIERVPGGGSHPLLDREFKNEYTACSGMVRVIKESRRAKIKRTKEYLEEFGQTISIKALNK